MIEWRRISTASCFATSAARASGRTLKPMITTAEDDDPACVAEPSSTSDSVIAPTPDRITFTLTRSVESFCKVDFNTSTDPCTSALMITSSSLTSLSPNASIPRLVVCSRAAWRLNRSEEHTSELQSRQYLVCRLLLENKHNIKRPKV